MAISTNKEIAVRTKVFQKEVRVMPIDHLVDTRGNTPGESGKPHDRKALVLYI